MDQFAGAVLALLAIALLINLVERGPGGARDWLAAKFLGRETAA